MISYQNSQVFSVIKYFLLTNVRPDNSPTIGPFMNSFIATSSLQQEDGEEEVEAAVEGVTIDGAGDDG